jgi:hypothetical protein
MSKDHLNNTNMELAAPEINNLGVEWYRSGELTTAFQFFYHCIERFKAGRTSAFPPATRALSEASSSSVDTAMMDASAANANLVEQHATLPAESPSGPVDGSFTAAAAPISPTRARLQSIFANAFLFQDQAYRCPFRISFTSESQLYYFSPEPTQDYILCSCVAVFNMAVTVYAMDDATALHNHIQNRHAKVKGLFQHCLQLLSLVLDPVVVPMGIAANKDGTLSPATIAVSQVAHLNVVTLAICDLLALACLNNLIVMCIEDELPSECSPIRNAHLESLLQTVTSVKAERYSNDSDVIAIMARLADMFLITVFFVLKFPPGPAAAAA